MGRPVGRNQYVTWIVRGHVSGAGISGYYSVHLKANAGDESRLNGPIFFALLGISSTVLLAPVILLFSVTGIETFVLPSGNALMMLAINGLLGAVLADALWMVAVLLTGPVLCELGKFVLLYDV